MISRRVMRAILHLFEQSEPLNSSSAHAFALCAADSKHLFHFVLQVGQTSTIAENPPLPPSPSPSHITTYVTAFLSSFDASDALSCNQFLSIPKKAPSCRPTSLSFHRS